MASARSKGQLRLKRKRRASGARRKRKNRKSGTTPKFPIHREN